MRRKPQPGRIYHRDGRVTSFPPSDSFPSNPADSPRTPEYHRVAPIAQPPNTISITSAVVVPSPQAFITAILWASIVPIANLLAIEYTSFHFNPWPVFLTVFVLALALQWHSLLGEWRTLLWPEHAEETYTNTTEGNLPTAEHIKVQINSNDGRTASFLDLPISNAKLATFAIGLSHGGTTAEAAWVGTSQLFSRVEYVGLRDALISRGFGAWNSPEAHDRGWKLTQKGQSVFTELARKYENAPLTSQ